MPRLFSPRLLAPAAVTALLVGAVATPAHAADDASATFQYDASGTATVAKTGSVVQLGPSTLTVHLASDGTFTGSLPFAPASTSFKIIGLVPVSATVTYVPVGDVIGKLGKPPKTRVTSSASYYLRLSDVKTAGIPTPVGNACQTAAPVTIPIATPKGQKFNISKGGTLTGSFTIGQFANCGLTTLLINSLIPGAGNTTTVTLSNGRFIP
ncbi:hypothetical protein ACXR2U_17905 [Jatrophihabitans sp. YIM 134969]